MEDYRLDQSGQEVQNILDGAAMQVDLTAETERAELAEQTLQGNIDIEERDRKAADLTLQGNIDAEELRAKAAEKQNADDIDALEEKVPSGASSSNKLATESYVDDSVATATATFRGTYNLVSDLNLTVDATEQQIATALALDISTADNNDYCFVQVPTSSETPTEIKEIDRYKFNGTAWSFEYKLNNSGFTAAQWAAINSGITSGDVTKLAALPTNAELTTLLNGKQDVLTFDNVPTEGSSHPVKSGGVYSAIDDEKTARENADSSLSSAIEAILLLIPSAATSLNKLADKAFVNSSIATASATFRGTYNLVTDLSLTVSATHAQIATALAGAVSDEDNNDYAFVQIPTSDATPTQIAKTERYKFNGTIWEYEYDLNNSGYTAAQWAAINSGITEALVTKLSALPTNTELTSALGVLTSSITTINQKIPSAASQANQLVDTAAMESYIVQVLDVLTASFNVTSTDGHVTVQISQVDGKITSVAVSTSDIASAASLSLIAGRVTTAEGNISTNAADIANLQAAYAALTQSDIVVVSGALPSSGQQQNIIYRQPDQDHTPPQFYSDYMWNGTAWVLMATYNNAIDPRPKKGSQNLVTSGGVFDNMGALDVSELNATENPHTLAQYADMSAALAAIPTDYQKGGMSIKFVQSSDNKYVQYRLMSANWSTTVTDWINEDDEPIAETIEKSISSENLINENYIVSGGNNFYFPIENINFFNRPIIKITGNSSLQSVVCYYYDSSDNQLSYSQNINTGIETLLLVPDNAVKAVLYHGNNGGDIDGTYPISLLASPIDDSIKELNNMARPWIANSNVNDIEIGYIEKCLINLRALKAVDTTLHISALSIRDGGTMLYFAIDDNSTTVSSFYGEIHKDGRIEDITLDGQLKFVATICGKYVPDNKDTFRATNIVLNSEYLNRTVFLFQSMMPWFGNGCDISALEQSYVKDFLLGFECDSQLSQDDTYYIRSMGTRDGLNWLSMGVYDSNGTQVSSFYGKVLQDGTIQDIELTGSLHFYAKIDGSKARNDVSAFYDWGTKLKLNNGYLSNSRKQKPLANKTIVCFGDSVTQFYARPSMMGYCNWLSSITGATVINVGIGGSRICPRKQNVTSVESDDDAFALLDIENMVSFAASGDYTLLQSVKTYLENKQDPDLGDVIAAITRLMNIDWSKVDMVTIFGGTNDFTSSTPVGDVSSTGATICGALNNAISRLMTAYPKVKLGIITPTHRYFGVNEDLDSDVTPINNVHLGDICEKLDEVAHYNHLPSLNLYKRGLFNKYNHAYYFTRKGVTDGVHPWNGFDVLGEIISAWLMSCYAFALNK